MRDEVPGYVTPVILSKPAERALLGGRRSFAIEAFH